MKRNNIKSLIRNKILNRTLINRIITIEQHSDPNLIGISGTIRNESKNMLLLELAETRAISVAKSTGVFKFKIEEIDICIDGVHLIGDQKSRAKKKFRNW